MVGICLLAATAALSVSAQTSDGAPLLKDCSDQTDVVAIIQPTDRVQVRYGLGGGAQICYAVSATVNGETVSGFLLGSAHPDVAAFEREARSHIPPLPEPPKPPPAAARSVESQKKVEAPEAIQSFAGLSGMSPEGRRVSLSSMGQPTLVLYFWSANSKKSVREADGMDGVYETYHGKGVGLVGVVSGGSVAQVRKILSEEEVIWPQILDNGSIAARYPETKETRYFILDQRRNVVAAVKSADEVQRELQKLRRQQMRGSE